MNSDSHNHVLKAVSCNDGTKHIANGSELRSDRSLAEIEDFYLCSLQGSALTPDSVGMINATSSDIDRLDMAWCLMVAVVSAFVTTNEGFAKWLEGVHDAASGKYREFDAIQKIIGSTLRHQGDWMDQYEGQWNTRDAANAYAQFHRLLGGHDIFASGESLTPHNPFVMMMQQKGNVFEGALQATRHLIADTFSSQGLPVPFSSYLDTVTDDGRPWNRIIDIVQELSIETTGNKQQAEAIYSHLFTLRAQDFIGGGAALALTAAYIETRNIEDKVRKVQIRLIAYSLSFFAQAIVGMVRQKGIPYINYPIGFAMTKELVGLLLESNRRTLLLEKRTQCLNEEVVDVIDEYDMLRDLL